MWVTLLFPAWVVATVLSVVISFLRHSWKQAVIVASLCVLVPVVIFFGLSAALFDPGQDNVGVGIVAGVWGMCAGLGISFVCLGVAMFLRRRAAA